MKAKLLTALFSCSLALGGCSVVNFVTPYKIDIPQGNAITADQVANLKVGMTRGQVRFVLGTPLLADPLHANRWDYVYRDAPSGHLKEQHHLAVFFDGDRVLRWEGDSLPEPAYNRTMKIRGSAPAEANAIKQPANPGDAGSKDVGTKPLINKDY